MAAVARPSGAQLLALYYDDPQKTAMEMPRSDAAMTFPNAAIVPAG